MSAQREDGTMSSTIDDPGQWFERIVYALVMRADEPAVVEAMGQDVAVLRFPRADSTLLLLRYLPDRDQAMAERLAEGIRQLSHTPLEVALIGGPPEARALLERGRPRFTRKPVSRYHLREDGTLWQERPGRRRRTPLVEHLTPPQGAWPPPEDERARFAARLQEQMAAAHQAQTEIGHFAEILRARRPVATWALAGTILVVYGLQMLWGAAEGGAALVRMGALVPKLIRDGEWWRLVSCTFLHGGLAHVALNTMVLVMLGNVLERILGTSRFLILYGASALAGSLASFLIGGERISVGASGALWGLLIANFVLAFRPRGLLPAAIVERAKRAAISNLIPNLLISFLPRVDTAAHFGGGGMSLLLLGTGLLTTGMRPLVAPESDAVSGEAPRHRRAFAAGAALVVLVLAAGLGLGLATGRAWVLDEPPAMMRREVPALGLSLEVPAQLAPGDVAIDDETSSILFGDFRLDPAVVEVVRVAMDELPAERLEAELDGLAAALARPPERGRVSVAPQRVQVQGRPAMRVGYELENGLLVERGVLLGSDHLVTVELGIWPAYRAAYQGLLMRMLESISPLPGTTPPGTTPPGTTPPGR
jgi:rhomboid protease GluP